MIWVIGGTSECTAFLRCFSGRVVSSKFIVTVVSEYSRKIICEIDPLINVLVGKLDLEGMTDFVDSKKIEIIIDLSHPYAEVVTKNAIEVAKKYKKKYFRLNRESYIKASSNNRSDSPNHLVDNSHPYRKSLKNNCFGDNRHNLEELDFDCGVKEELDFDCSIKEELDFNFSGLDLSCGAILCSNIEEIVELVRTLQGNILITLGGNCIDKFKALENLKNIYFRILPDIEVIKRCCESGILAKNIIGMQGPFSKKMNKVMIEDYKIKYLITKNSGISGGEKEKIEACLETGCKLIFLKRPAVGSYGEQYSSLGALIVRICEEL